MLQTLSLRVLFIGKELPPEYEGIIHQIFANDKQLSDIREIIERKLWDPNYKVV